MADAPAAYVYWFRSLRSLTAAANIAFTARLKSLRLLTAQAASNQTASCAASIMASVGLAIGFKAARASRRYLVEIGLEVAAIGSGDGTGDEIDHAPGAGRVSSRHRVARTVQTR